MNMKIQYKYKYNKCIKAVVKLWIVVWVDEDKEGIKVWIGEWVMCVQNAYINSTTMWKWIKVKRVC